MKIIKYGMVILWCLLIFFFSSETGTASEDRSKSLLKGIIEEVNEVLNLNLTEEKIETLKENGNFLIRKVAHFTLYFVLAILTYYALDTTPSKKHLIYTILFCFIYAITDEVHQLSSIGRSGSWKDVLIDTTGALTGAFLYHIGGKKHEKNIRTTI